MSRGSVDFVLENGRIKAVMEDIDTQDKYLSKQEKTLLELGLEPEYIDIIKYMRILEFIERKGRASKKEIAFKGNLSRSMRKEIRRYYQSPLSTLCSLGIISMIRESRRYTVYQLTPVGRRALQDYKDCGGSPTIGTNFNKEGDWLVPKHLNKEEYQDEKV